MSQPKSIYWTNERRRLADLQPWPRNPRQIKTDQAKRLVESFDQFGQVETIAIGPDCEIYNGHQRLNVLLQQHGGDYEVDVRLASRALTEKEREKLTIFLHKGAAGEWDFDTLANEFELSELLEWGFNEKELDLNLWAGDQPEDPGAQMDRAEELREKWQVETGQLWQLGEHRLICGDCTDKAVMERVMGGEKANILFIDPPYGIGLISGEHGKVGGGTKKYPTIEFDTIYGDNKSFDPTIFFDVAPKMIIWGGNYFANKLPNAKCWFIWNKMHPIKRTFASCELAWTNLDKHAKVYECKWDGWTKEGENESKRHPTQKPLKLFIDILTDIDGMIVADFFLGSGTTLIACERLGRKCRAVEISPAYCAVAIQRWVDLTGGEPILVIQAEKLANE